jgi:hypothetical protein
LTVEGLQSNAEGLDAEYAELRKRRSGIAGIETLS